MPRPSVLNKMAVIIGLIAAFFTIDAVSFDSEVNNKISHAQQLAGQNNEAILHNLRLLSQRQIVESLSAQIRLEEFLLTWYAAELERETEAGRQYELQHQQAQSQRRITSLYERYNDASETLEALQGSVPGGPDLPIKTP